MKSYTLAFGTGASLFSGLSPTMLMFYDLSSGVTVAPPSISESPTGQGVYSFQYGATHPIWFLADAATTSPGTSGRYIVGQIDPADRSDEYGNTIVGIGNTTMQDVLNIGVTLLSIGESLSVTVSGIGSTASSIGGSGVYPIDMFGYLKRIDALLEGTQQFVKGSGVLTQYDLTGSTLLITRTITNSASLVTKT